MNRASFTLGCSFVILDEARNEPYKRYGEVSTGIKMAKMRQERQSKSSLAWLDWCGVEFADV